MSQFLRPVADNLISSGWNRTSGAAFFECIDEASPNDADYLYTNNNHSGGGALFKLSAAQEPQAGTTTVRYRRAKTNAGSVVGTGSTVQLRAEIWQGGYFPSGTKIAEDSYQTCSGSWTTRSWTPDLSAVTDWSDLYVFLQPTGGTSSPFRGAGCSWVEVEIPDPAGVYGAIAATEGQDSFSASGLVIAGLTGQLDATEAGDTASANGLVTVGALMAAMEAPDVAAFSGEVPIVGHAAMSEAPDVMGFGGSVASFLRLDTKEAPDGARIIGQAYVLPSDGLPYVCERCGFEYPLSQLRKEWTGLWVCRDDYDPKPAQMKAPKVGPEGVPKIPSRFPYPNDTPNMTRVEDL